MQTHLILIFILVTVAVVAIAANGPEFPPPFCSSWSGSSSR
jgi:hypothetical protein